MIPIVIILVLISQYVSGEGMLLPEQIKAARSLLGWNQNDLAQASTVGVATIKRIELSQKILRGRAENIYLIEKALEEAGIVFIASDENGGPGVRLRDEPDRD